MNEDKFNKAKELFSRIKILKADRDYLKTVESDEYHWISDLHVLNDPDVAVLLKEFRAKIDSYIDKNIELIEKEIESL
ncbi:MAG: hypothetical protein ABUK13_05610 [Gammaproteobacteria bacterium]